MPIQYKVIPAPKRGLKSRGIKGSDARFAHGIEKKLNELAAEGWEFVRAETLPSEERDGLMSKTTVFQNVLVFRKTIDEIVKEEAIIDDFEEDSEEEVTDAKHSDETTNDDLLDTETPEASSEDN